MNSARTSSPTSATTTCSKSASRRQRQDILGHVTGTSPYYDDHRFANLLHLKILRSPHAHARIRSIDDSAAARAPGVKRIIRAADVPVNLNTLSEPHPVRQGRRAVAGVATWCATRASRSSASSPPASAPRSRRWRWCASPTISCRRCSTSRKRSSRARRRSTPPIRRIRSSITANTIIRNCATATPSRRSSRPTSCSKTVIRCRRSSTRRPKPTARSRCPTPTAASSSTPRRRRCSSRSTRRRRSTRCSRTSCISSAARSAAASAARSTR